MSMINSLVLMSGADFFSDQFAINPYMSADDPVDVDVAIQEHLEIQKVFARAGIKITKIDPPKDCQDGVYTANWALIVGKKAILANLPNKRKLEEKYAEKVLKNLGYNTVKIPENLHFSGQGDALPCGKYLFCGSEYRTSAEVHRLLAEETDLEVVSLQTIPLYNKDLDPVINPITGWPDSFFYDLDLALAIVKVPSRNQCVHRKHTLDDSAFSQRKTQRAVHTYGEESITDEKRADAKEHSRVGVSDSEQAERCDCRGLIAWCPEAFMPESQEKLKDLNIDKIEVSLEEALTGFACNLVSTGQSVVMSNQAPKLQKELEKYELTVFAPEITELSKGGGFIRCISLTLI